MESNAFQKGLLLIALAVGGLALVLVSFNPSAAPAPEPAELTFEVHLSTDADDQLVAKLGVRNSGMTAFRGDEAFAGVMDLRGEAGEPQAHVEMAELTQSLAPGESVFPTTWSGGLVPGAYRLTWGAPRYAYTMIEFSVVESGADYQLGDDVVARISLAGS